METPKIVEEKILLPIKLATRFVISLTPTTLVTCVGKEGKPNIIAIGAVHKSFGAPMESSEPGYGCWFILVHPARYSHRLIEETGEYVINIPSTKEVKACWTTGFKSGRNTDKFKETNLTPVPAKFVKPPLIKECPINIECKVVETIKPKFSGYTFFFGQALAIHAVKGAWEDDMRNIEKFPSPLYVPGPGGRAQFRAPGKVILTKADMI